MPTLRIFVLAPLCVLAMGAPIANADDARYEGSSLDGSIVFFSTAEAPGLLGDTDLKTDIYLRAYDSTPGIEDFVTRKVSIGPAGGNNALDAIFAGASDDGYHVFFSTRESLVEGDTDRAADLYLRNIVENETTLVSVADPSCPDESCGNAEANVTFVQRGVAADGSHAFFMTNERLSSDDTDDSADIYVRDLEAGTTSLVSAGDPSCQSEACGSGNVPVLGFDDGSDDGNLVVFRSEEKLAAADEDGGKPDLYRRNIDTGATALVSTQGPCLACVPAYGGSSSDGAHVIFETRDPIDAGDGDSSQDVYDWSSGAATLVSTGPAGGDGPVAAVFPGVVGGFPGISVGGDRVFFETAEQLVGADEDKANDVYERSGGSTALVSQRDSSCEPAGCGGSEELPASFRWVSPDGSGSGVVFGTAERLASTDTDVSHDVYLRSGGGTSLLSTGSHGGSGAFNASFAGASRDGSHVLFITPEILSAADEDQSSDIYDGFDGLANLVSIGPAGGNADGFVPPGLTGVSGDGEHAFFTADEELTADDVDGDERDVYSRSAGKTLLVSIGNSVLLGPAPPSQLSTDPESPGSSKTPSIVGEADAGSSIQVYTDSSCAGEPVETGTAEQLSGAGIPVAVATGSTTSFWLSAEAEGITSACAGPVKYRHLVDSEDEFEEPVRKSTKAGEGSVGGGLVYVTPKTLITFGPSFKTKRRKTIFRFTDSTGQRGSSFVCKLDRDRWRGCGSPIKLKRLRVGRHVFQVKAVNAVGEWEALPAKRKFQVVAR